MAQLVFVHGVAARDNPEMQIAIDNRNQLFREILFAGGNVDIRSPMWGKLVPSIPHAVFETDQKVGTYSLNVGATAGLGGGLTGGSGPAGAGEITIGEIGKKFPVVALDAICSEIVDQAARDNRPLTVEELAAFRKSSELITSQKAASAFPADASDDAIAEQLQSGTTAAYSIKSWVGDAISAVSDRVRNAASTLGYGAVRDELGPAIGLFIGDVFVYLKQGTIRQKIRAEIGPALTEAHAAAKAGGGPLIVVGHSMGGVILVDMLADPPAAGLPPDITVDALLTVGSQPGFFAVLDLLVANPPAGSPRRRPDCVKNWFNVFDPIDPLAFRTEKIFKEAVDLSFDSVTGIMEAHTKYFHRPQFYARSRKRLQDLKIL
jgi:hypothetical protein